jgi:hypothetical protein
MRHCFNTKWNARIPEVHRTQEGEAITLTTTPSLCRSICNWPEMRVMQQDVSCILGAVFHGKGGDMGKGKKEKL